jgi:eukaryotic-like serine/threonine-protein kinase
MNKATSTLSVTDNSRVIAALEIYLESLRAGAPWSREEFLARYADVGPELADCLSGIELVQAVAADLVDSFSEGSEAVPPIAQLGDYRIVREVGRGGMGVVYEACQVSLGRRVALKVLPIAAAIDPRQRQRFQIEAHAAAQLHHPHIVPIFGVGYDHGTHYYAMQFVEGRSLAAWLRELRAGANGIPLDAESLAGPAVITTEKAPDSTASGASSSTAFGCEPQSIEAALVGTAAVTDSGERDGAGMTPFPARSDQSLAPASAGPPHQDRAYCRTVAQIGADAADALEHAHSLGILHRDIKPGNLLIDPEGSVWVTDFGLARFPGDPGLTRTGDLIGTLRYMSPEQALARHGVVDQRSDVYALGATLYELLTLRPAHDGRDHQEVLRQISLDEPTPPRRLNPAIPRDLETIVMKAMAKDATSRYATAGDLAADFQRFLADCPILARRPGLVERTMRWAHRRREIVMTAAAILLVSLAGTTALVWTQSKKREALFKDYYPLVVDQSPMFGLSQADGFTEQSGVAGREQTIRIQEKMLEFYEKVVELPATDVETRKIIGRARSRLGYARAMLSSQKGGMRPDPQLMADAINDYRKSIALFDKLLAESPGDRKIRHFLADSLGVFGIGCCFRFTQDEKEAETCYRRAIELRRELVKSVDTALGPLQLGSAPENIELHNLEFLVYTTQIAAGMLDQKGKTDEAEALRRQVEQDIAALTERCADAQSRERWRVWSRKMTEDRSSTADMAGRRDLIMCSRLAIALDPDNAIALNDLAWSLVSFPDDSWYDPAEGLKLAKKAVRLDPNNWRMWNTVGVAAFRTGDWREAAELLHKSISIGNGSAHDFFFLAMTCWEQGKKKDARVWFDRAVDWMEKNEKGDPRKRDPELRRFYAEAEAHLCLRGHKPRNTTGTTEERECPVEIAPPKPPHSSAAGDIEANADAGL